MKKQREWMFGHIKIMKVPKFMNDMMEPMLYEPKLSIKSNLNLSFISLLIVTEDKKHIEKYIEETIHHIYNKPMLQAFSVALMHCHYIPFQWCSHHFTVGCVYCAFVEVMEFNCTWALHTSTAAQDLVEAIHFKHLTCCICLSHKKSTHFTIRVAKGLWC